MEGEGQREKERQTERERLKDRVQESVVRTSEEEGGGINQMCHSRDSPCASARPRIEMWWGSHTIVSSI